MPGPRSNTAAFLLLERERRAVAARLRRPHQRRNARFRDLVLITKLIRLEYEYLVGPVGRETGHRSLSSHGEDMPEGWAQPWGAAPMFELREAFDHYRHQRDRLAGRLSAASRAGVAADADRHLERIVCNPFATVTGERGPEIQDDRAAPEPQGQDAQPLMPAAADDQATAQEARPWTSNWYAWAAATAGVVLLVAAIDAAIHNGLPSDSGSAPTDSVATRLTEPPLAGFGNRPPLTQPATGRDAAQRSEARRELQSDARPVRTAPAEGDRTAPPASEAQPPTPEQAPEPAPTPTPTAAPIVTPPPTSATASATAPQQEFGFEN